MQRESVRSAQGVAHKPSVLDLCLGILTIAIYAAWIHHYQFQGTLADADLYRMLRGLLDGANNGTGLASSLHYGKGFSFGYLFALYRLADLHTLRDPQRSIALINGIGFCFAVAGAVFFWAALWALHGLRRASIAMALFLFAPISLEQGTSGHPSLVSFAFFAAAALLLFLPARGLRALACGAMASLLMMIALTMRADILLAFPFLVLARANFRSFRLLIQSMQLPGLLTAFAAATFFLIKQGWIDTAAQPGPSLHEFFNIYYRLSHIPAGVAICFLACGLFTALLGLIAIVRIGRSVSASARKPELRTKLLQDLIPPLALLLPSFTFWIANPTPARHFSLCLLAFSMLAARLLTTVPLPRAPVSLYAAAFGIVLANQACGALSGHIILSHYPFMILSVPGQPRVMPLVPIGDSIRFHRAVQAEMRGADDFAERVGGLCDTNLLVLSDHVPLLSSHLYGWPGPWTVEEGKLHRFSILTARNGHRTFLFVSVHEGWPEDPVAAVLATPGLHQFKLIRDPDTLSIYDKTAIPPDRVARSGCGP